MEISLFPHFGKIIIGRSLKSVDEGLEKCRKICNCAPPPVIRHSRIGIQLTPCRSSCTSEELQVHKNKKINTAYG